MQSKSIAVVGLGYVGLSLAVLLSTRYRTVGIDVDADRVRSVNMRNSYLGEKLIEDYMQEDLYISASTDMREVSDVDIIIIAVPTDYNESTNKFDTTILEKVVAQSIELNPDATIVIKSTVPVGYTDNLIERCGCNRIIFSPEFLREGSALYDCLHPSRIVVGTLSDRALQFSDLLCSVSESPASVILTTTNSEAESIKLFANTYLAMRIAFFNELDTYSQLRGLDTSQIIQGVCADSRIGNYYNNPSFGYGGYCLPKDTKQLRANYENVPSDLISAVIDSNATRKDFIANTLLAKEPRLVGVYRLVMKEGSNNFRASAVQDIIHQLESSGVSVLIYEPLFEGSHFESTPVTQDLSRFKESCDIILTNRMSSSLEDVMDKVFTRDIFNAN